MGNHTQTAPLRFLNSRNCLHYQSNSATVPRSQEGIDAAHRLLPPVQVCPFSFPLIAEAALTETWTRDPFDRLITAHTRANGLAWLVTSDRRIREAYPRAVW
jgi:hypothetical protein